MAARLVADAYWLPASDASSSQDSSVVSLASLESSAPVVDNRWVNYHDGGRDNDDNHDDDGDDEMMLKLYFSPSAGG